MLFANASVRETRPTWPSIQKGRQSYHRTANGYARIFFKGNFIAFTTNIRNHSRIKA